MPDEPAAPADERPGLVCYDCSAAYPAGPEAPWRCECGHALDFDRVPVPSGDRPAYGDLETRRGLWAFDEFIPVDRRVSLGEGLTPLVDVPAFDAQCKLEYVSPTGSFKDRGATTVVSRAIELGVQRVVDDSSGNAGSAIATYAARAGIPAEVYVPSGVKQRKRAAIERTGADVVAVPGSRRDVTEACIGAVERGDAWYASHAWSPAFYAGTMTAAFEIAAQRDWSVPDAVVVPIGHGTLFLGLHRGFERLLAAGWIERRPRLLGVQAAGYAPIAERFHGETDGQNDVADGIRIREPAREGQLVAAIEATDGDAIAVSDRAVEAALGRLHRNGLHAEPTTAVVLAGLEQYRDRGVVRPTDDVVLPLTGSGRNGS